MESKSHISLKTKKILLGTGIVFGTVLAFVVSFFLAFSLIINPINFVTIGGEETAAENEELKTQVQSLEDEVEMLNATVEKYKSSASSQIIVQEVPVSAPQQSSQASGGQTQTGAETDNESVSGGDADGGAEGEAGFAPETMTTPDEGIEPEVELDVTVIDISE
ncbi:MAG: hypothetical protein IJW15_06835 [Clostridia bacterium]|nr:hypothetical protein [Clostridia bacterium]